MSWMFLPAYYTHSPVTGQRVAQYEPERPSYVVVDPTYQESGYRHEFYAVGNEVSNVVKTWGAGTAIRPYGEWEYPYRPGATPYWSWGNSLWAQPYGSWQSPYGFNGQQNFYSPGYGPWQPGYGYGGPINGGGWTPKTCPWPQPRSQPLPANCPSSMPGAVNVPPNGAAMHGQAL
jgi:hypothetical protein